MTEFQEVFRLMRAYVKAREAEKVAGKERARLGELIKHYLQPGQIIYDGETGIEARLQTRQGREHYDVSAMPAELVRALQAAGALQVDVDVIRALQGKSSLPDEIRPWAIPGPTSTALIVEELSRGW